MDMTNELIRINDRLFTLLQAERSQSNEEYDRLHEAFLSIVNITHRIMDLSQVVEIEKFSGEDIGPAIRAAKQGIPYDEAVRRIQDKVILREDLEKALKGFEYSIDEDAMLDEQAVVSYIREVFNLGEEENGERDTDNCDSKSKF